MILLFFTGCEQKEDNDIFVLENKSQTDIKRIKQQFEAVNLQDAFLKEAFKVKWNQYEVVDNSDGSLTYEFATNLRSKLDLVDDGLVKSKNTKKIFSVYKLLTKESADGNVSFEILTFTGNNSKELKEISLSDLADFDGALNYTTPEGIFVKDESYNKGVLVNIINQKPNPSLLFKAPSISSDYIYVYEIAYKDYYNRCNTDCGGSDTFYYNGAWYYNNSTGTTDQWRLVAVLRSSGLTENGKYHRHSDDPYYLGPHGGLRGDDPHTLEILNHLTGKRDCVYGKLQTNSLLIKMQAKFNGSSPQNLIIKEVSNLKDKNELVNGLTRYGNETNILIEINKEQGENRPSLAVARTILHEHIHAEIYRKIKSNGGGLHFDSLTNEYRLQDGSRAHFPSLFDAWNENPANPYHNYMATYYREALEFGLKEYAKLIGQTYPDQFYKDMAWNGLLETKAFAKQYASPSYAEQEKNRIIKTIVDFDKSGTNECQTVNN